ncbi:MAG TPA: PfkB family carbohydrate kinase [Solirubrobacteraceae bacterium]|nr:PfkB family carbohydrate kinase [Solirubrobacteraceae bacterium]
MKERLQYDYTTVGHVTIDVPADGSRRPGGSAFYAALQAARLGQRTLIVTQGVPREVEELLAPYGAELELRVIPARHTTTLLTAGWGPTRSQRVLAWAGAIERELRLDTRVLHLAPVARETPSRWHAPTAFVGLTPQGLMREWTAGGGEIALVAPDRSVERVAARCNALVLSRHERAPAAGLIQRGVDAGALVAITDESRPCTVLLGDGSRLQVEVPRVGEPLDDLGAGDVFAAALFVSLAAGTAVEGAVAYATAAAAVRMQGSGAGAIGDEAAIGRRLQAVAAGRA